MKQPTTQTATRPTALDYLRNILIDADIDARVDKDALALELINECGRQTPRYMDSSFFAIMATNFFKIKAREITRDLDALAIEYSPVDEFNVELEYHGGVKTEYGKTNTRTDNLQRKFAQGDYQGKHYVSADNETGVELRTQDEQSTRDDYTNDTGNQTFTDSGADTVKDNHTETKHGHNRPAQELLSSEFEVNKINIYRVIALDFSDALMLAVY